MTSVKLFILIACLTFGSIGIAQTSYVEVIVTDSIDLPLTNISYIIERGTGKEKSMFDFTTGLKEEKDTGSPADLYGIMKDLEMGGYTCVMVGPVPDISDDADSFISIDLKTIGDYFQLDQKVKTIAGVHGKRIHVDHSSPDAYKEELFRELYRKAFNEAELMAKAAGAKVGKMLIATEHQGIWSDYGDMMKQFMNKMPYMNMNNEDELSKYYIRKFTFRFELK